MEVSFETGRPILQLNIRVEIRGQAAMTVTTSTAEVSTAIGTDIVDITGLVTQHLAQSGIHHGARSC